MKILVCGGTVFASKYTAKYFRDKGNEVYVLNRNTRPQLDGVRLISGDRHSLGDVLKSYHFDAVLDVTSYNKHDIECLTDSLGGFDNYIMVSSSAVYPETLKCPFKESDPCGANVFWGDYGTNKIEAEKYLQNKVTNAYIIRPPYLYGEMNNLYREAFVFDCAEADRPFYIPGNGEMRLQFFDIDDICRFMEILLQKQPEQHVFNVGNPETVTVSEWIRRCYEVLGKKPRFEYVDKEIPQRSYFPFYDYEYVLDVSGQKYLMPDTKPMEKGLCESYEWYKNNRSAVIKKPLINFIDENFNSSNK